MHRLLAFAGTVALAFGIGAPAQAQQPRGSTIEGGTYIEFGPSFVNFQNIESAVRCRDLCLQDQRCRVWRYVSGTAPADYGRARRVCVLGERTPQSRTKPGGWVTSGQVQ